MAKWTLVQLRDHLRERIDDYGQDFYTDAEINKYLNEGIMQISKELGLESYTKITLTDKNKFELPLDFVELQYLFVNGKQLNHTKIEYKNRVKNSYYLWGNTVYFTEEQDLNAEVELFYYRRHPLLVNNEDVLEFDEQYNTIIITFAQARCKQKDDEFGIANALFEQFDNLVAEMKIEKENRASDKNEVIFARDEGRYYEGNDY